MDPTPLEGKNAIVTGGSRGIGQGIAIELARRGAKVLITYANSLEGAKKTLSLIETQTGSKAHAIQADSTQAPSASQKILKEALAFFPEPHIDIIINNAGHASAAKFNSPALNQSFFDTMFHTNVLFPTLLYTASKPYLRKDARIVNISSVSARAASADTPMYGASKAALESLTRSMAEDLGRNLGGTANAVEPGPVGTDMWHKSDYGDMEAVGKAVAAMTPAENRIGEVEDIVPVAAFLCDPSARWVSASVVNANGGLIPV